MAGGVDSVGPVSCHQIFWKSFRYIYTLKGCISQNSILTELSDKDLSALAAFHSSEMQFRTERGLLTSKQFLQDRLWDIFLKGSTNFESLLKQTLHNGKQGQTKTNMKTLRCRNRIPSSIFSQLIPSSLLQTIGNVLASLQEGWPLHLYVHILPNQNLSKSLVRA